MKQVAVQTRVPEDLAAALRERAEASERSISAEVRVILKEVVMANGGKREAA